MKKIRDFIILTSYFLLDWRSPGRLVVAILPLGYGLLVGAVGVCSDNVESAVAASRPGKPLAVRRPGGLVVVAAERGKLGDHAAGGAHYEDVAAGCHIDGIVGDAVVNRRKVVPLVRSLLHQHTGVRAV